MNKWDNERNNQEWSEQTFGLTAASSHLALDLVKTSLSYHQQCSATASCHPWAHRANKPFCKMWRKRKEWKQLCWFSSDRMASKENWYSLYRTQCLRLDRKWVLKLPSNIFLSNTRLFLRSSVIIISTGLLLEAPLSDTYTHRTNQTRIQNCS